MAKDPDEDVEETEGSDEEPEEEEPEKDEEEEEIVTMPGQRRGSGFWWIVIVILIIAAIAGWYWGIKLPADRRAEAERKEKSQAATGLAVDARGALSAALDSISGGDVKAGLDKLDSAKTKAQQAAVTAQDAADEQAQLAYTTLSTHIQSAIGDLVKKNEQVEAKRKELEAAQKDLQNTAEQRVNSLLEEAKSGATGLPANAPTPAPAGGGQ
jgi:hypothetical protein